MVEKKRKYTKDGYYRRPNEGEDAGWIIVGPVSANGTVVEDFIERGFEPLRKYGHISHTEKNPWRTILEHPDGPGEFPLDQIMALRWWRPQDIPLPGVHFPQLAGHKVKEIPCPDCKRPFFAVDGEGGVGELAKHLRIMHGWDTKQLDTYGERVDINFDAIYKMLEHEFKEVELGVSKCKSCDEDIPGKLADHECKVPV